MEIKRQLEGFPTNRPQTAIYKRKKCVAKLFAFQKSKELASICD